MSDSTVRAADIKHWQNITFNDTAVMTAWLAAIGVREHAVYRSEDDPDVIVHGEWIGPGGAGFMGGSAREGAGSPPVRPPRTWWSTTPTTSSSARSPRVRRSWIP